MGARFLDDADLNSREQCLRLCCETENCDVFVFEEKVSRVPKGRLSGHNEGNSLRMGRKTLVNIRYPRHNG